MQIDFSKYADGLAPAIVQDHQTGVVLMLGFMNQEALDETLKLGRVTFFSRSKQRLWTKGEESGHYLELHQLLIDCDQDTILVKARPHGPVCHTGADTCFGELNEPDFLKQLIATIDLRYTNRETASYTSSLFDKGINAVAQKVGEEAVELVIEAKDNDPVRFLDEAADLLFHYLVLLRQKDQGFNQVLDVLRARHQK